MTNILEVARLQEENEAMKADIKLMALTIKKTLTELGFITPTGEVKFDSRSIGKIIPLAISGKLSENLSSIGDLVPLFDKYKHLAEL